MPPATGGVYDREEMQSGQDVRDNGKMHLAQVNVGKIIAPLDSPEMAGFVARLATVNAKADSAPGFIWRLQDEGVGAISVRIFEDDLVIVNISVWESPEALTDFVYKESDHSEALRRRKEWFETSPEVMVACWLVAEGHLPSLAEARDKLMLLREIGSSSEAFPLKAASHYYSLQL